MVVPSMLVPLETLPGWPVVPNPSVLDQLGLLIGFPLLGIVAIVAIAKLNRLVQARRGQAAEDVDPTWTGRPETRDIGTDKSDRADVAAGQEVSEDDVGGAGARW